LFSDKLLHWYQNKKQIRTLDKIQTAIFIDEFNLYPMKHLLVICLFLVQFASYGQEFNFKTKQENQDYYAYITYLSQGPIDWLTETVDNVDGYSYRFIIVTSEIYENLYIEKISLGYEGNSKKLLFKRKIPLDEVFQKFGVEGERSGIEFIKWIDFTSFIIRFHSTNYVVSDIVNENIKIKTAKP
jgi:hypothetical protein